MSATIKGLWLLPTFYGLLAWMLALGVLIANVIHVNSISLEGWMVIGYVLLVFFFASIVFITWASRIIKRDYVTEVYKRDWLIFLLATIIGVAGLLKYIFDFSSFLGGFSEFLLILFTSSLDIRNAAADTGSVGVQLSYFSWISIFFGICLLMKIRMRLALRNALLLIVLLEILLNLTFIDRTRPTWILVTCVMGVAFSAGTHDLRIPKLLFYVGALPLIFFLAFAFVVGKYDVDAGILSALFAYVVGGFGYLDSVVSVRGIYEYYPVRSFYPISKSLESIGLISSVPSQVLENRSVPFETNVGTFVEPLLSDGGVLFVLIGVPVLAVVVNYISLAAFASRSIFGVFIWSNFIFCMLISFFVPQFNSTPIYLFVTLFMLVHLIPIKGRRYICRE